MGTSLIYLDAVVHYVLLCVCLSEMLLDDFLLTYLVFMSTSELCQALLGQYPSASLQHALLCCKYRLKVLLCTFS